MPLPPLQGCAAGATAGALDPGVRGVLARAERGSDPRGHHAPPQRCRALGHGGGAPTRGQRPVGMDAVAPWHGGPQIPACAACACACATAVASTFAMGWWS